MKTVLVTGATGFIGLRLLRRLVAQDLQIRVLVRDPDRLPTGLRRQVTIVRGSLGDETAVRRAVRGADHVLHLAALSTACERHAGAYRNTNTHAVAQLLDAAEYYGVKRFVHVSSVVAQPPAAPPRVPGFAHLGPTDYAASKSAAEEIVRRYVDGGHDAVIVRPTRVYGPGPWSDANGATRLAVMYLKGRLRVRLADRGVQANWVYVDDVAEGIELAARRGCPGDAYDLGGDDASLQEFLECVSEIGGVRRLVMPVPPLALLPAAYLARTWGRLGGHTSLTPEWLANFLEHRPVDSAAARLHLGYRPHSLQEGLSQTLSWVRGQQKGPWHVGSRQFS